MREGTIARAQALHVQGRLDEAEALYREALHEMPNALRALEGLGVLLFQRGRAEEAATLFQGAVEAPAGFARVPCKPGRSPSLFGSTRPSISTLKQSRGD